MLSSSVVFHFAFLCIVHHSQGIEPLSRYIVPIDILNEVVNQIFSSLQFKTHRESKIKEYSKMHKYFVSLARLHKNDWIDLLKIMSLDIKVDHGTGDYTTIINEVLNEENKTESVNDILSEENVNKHIENFLGTLENVKELYLRNNSFITVNYEILHRFHRNRQRNNTVNRLHLAQNDSDFWVPDGRRIYQGKRTKIKHFPFMASVHMFDQFTCAGSIIHADLVITAASCLQLAHNNRFYRENPSYLSVRIGSSTYDGGDRVPVLEVYFYPSYEPKTLKNNLAILRLQRVIKFHKKNKNVKKIRVDTNAWALPSNTDGITIIGWGARKKSNKIYNPWKNKLAMDVLYFYGLADCRDVYSKALVTKKNFCAGFISRGGGACNRDVGAPGVVDGILTGVVSFGSPNCGERDSPTVFTKLGYYIDWIEDIMAQDPPKQSVRITTRRPHLFHTIMSTLPLHDSNFLIEPIDLSKVPDIRDLDVRMPPEDKNEFINGEFNSIQSVSRQTFPTSKQTIEPNPKEPKNFVDITRHRDENKNKGSPEKTYEPPRLNPIYTVMDNFDEDEILLGSNDRVVSTSTIADLLARTRAQNKELKDDKTNEHTEKSESVEDTSEISDDTRETITAHNFESTAIDKWFKLNHTDAEKLLSSVDYDDDNETVVVQQSLPVQLISEEKGILIKTPEKVIVNEKKTGVSPKVKQPVRSIKEKDLDKEIDKFLESLDFEELLLSEEELTSQVLADHEFPEQYKNQKVTPVPLNHKKYSLQDQETKPALKNDDMLPVEDLAPEDDNVFPLQDQNTQPASKKIFLNQQHQKKKALPKNYYTFPILDEKTEPPPNNYYTFSVQDKKTEPARTNDYIYPQPDQEVEPFPKNDHFFSLQVEKPKPAPKKKKLNQQQHQKKKALPINYYTFPIQDKKTEPPPKNYSTFSLQDEKTEPTQTNDYMYPQPEQEVEPSPKNDYKFPLQDQKTEPRPKKYFLYSKKGLKTKPALEIYNTVPQKDDETKSAQKNSYMFQLQDRKTKPPQKKYYTVSLQHEETESAPTKDYMYPQQDQEAEPAPTNDYKFPLPDQKTETPPKKKNVNQQQGQKEKAQPKNYFTFPLQPEAEPTRTKDYMYAQQDQETGLALTNYHKVPLQDQKTKTPSKKFYTIPIQYDEIKPAQTNDDGFLPQTQGANPAQTHNVVLSTQDQKAKPAQINSNAKPKPALKGEDILTFLYLADNDRTPDDPTREALSAEKKKFKDLAMSLVYDVIAEELRKKNRK